MEGMIKLLASFEYGHFPYFWIGSILILFLIYFPFFKNHSGLRIDLNHWQRSIAFQSEKAWIISAIVATISTLMATVLINPQIITKPVARIYGKPVMAVIDVSGSMDFKGIRSVEGKNLSNIEKARRTFNDLLSRDLGVDFGLLLFSTENYIARYFSSNKEFLNDTLENDEEITFISTGTRIAEALAKARTFFLENFQDGDKAIVLISDLDLEGSRKTTTKMAEEIKKALWTGIKVYVIIIENEKIQGGHPTPPPPRIKGVKMVSMTDKREIDRICKEIASMKSSLITEETCLIQKSLIPFLVSAILGLIALCIILSETRFRKIPLAR